MTVNTVLVAASSDTNPQISRRKARKIKPPYIVLVLASVLRRALLAWPLTKSEYTTGSSPLLKIYLPVSFET